MSDGTKKDTSDTLIDNEDLLSILGANTSTDAASALDESDEVEADKKMKELKAIADQLEESTKGSNPGSGDLDKDLSDWFDGRSSLPSDDLNSYVSNSMIKMDYGTSRHTLSNFSKMGVLSRFLDSSFEIMFDDTTIMTLDPDDLEERVKLAFTMYRELGTLNQRTIQNIRDYHLKANTGSDDVDKMSLLLSSIPSDKLKALLLEITGEQAER